MATKKIEPGIRPNRVRFVLLEADLSDNNFTALAQAITQALKPSPAPASKYLPPSTRIPPTLNGSGPDNLETEEPVEDEEMQSSVEPVGPISPKPARSSRKPKYTVPEFQPDLDVIGTSITFKDFAAHKRPRATLGVIW